MSEEISVHATTMENAVDADVGAQDLVEDQILAADDVAVAGLAKTLIPGALVREVSRDARVATSGLISRVVAVIGDAGKPVSRADRAGPGEEPELGASLARLAKHGGERLQGNAAIPLANVALGGCQQLIEFEPGLVTFVGRRAQDDKVVLAVLGDEDRLSRLAADSFDFRRLIA